MKPSTRIHLASLLSLLGASQALAQAADGSPVRPAVMLLVDTSGSMERVPDDGSNPDCEDCVPTCTGNSAEDSANKTRWALTVEALTGTINDYKCEVQNRSAAPYDANDYDYGYYLPHISFTNGLQQEPDGILDAFRNRVKFGLMTFDGVGTTIGGETLVRWTDWLGDNNPAFLARANGGPGMYSYGRPKRLSFPGCPTDYGINAGARGPTAPEGAMIRVGKSDNQPDIAAVNDRIQESLLAVRPFGGTPIAAMLDDLKYYIDGGDTDSDLSMKGDSYYNCRERVAILITDGAPDALFRDTRFKCYEADSVTPACAANSDPNATSTARCACPYDPAETIAEELVKGGSGKGLLSKLIVVAYNVYDDKALTILDKIGEKGLHGVALPGKETATYKYLVEAKGQAELRAALNEQLVASSKATMTRSVPISVNTGDALLGENSRRYDITAGYTRPQKAEEPWGGLLYRQRVLCEGEAGATPKQMTAAEGDIIHERLNTRTTPRDLFTVKPRFLLRAGGTLLAKSYDPRAEPVQDKDSSYDDRAPAELLDLLGVRNTTSVQNRQKPDGTPFSPLSLLDPDNSIIGNHQLVDTSVEAAPFDENLESGFFGDANNNRVSGETDDLKLIVDYVVGRTRMSGGKKSVMADIIHSNPTAMVPVNLHSGARMTNTNSAYSGWLNKLATNDKHYSADGRPGIIFVGTNDGVLHAFNLEDWRDRGGKLHEGGDELWAFTPPALFGKMASMLSTHQLMFDGTPIVQDVVLQKKGTSPPIFRTILVAAVRGAPAYVALDVTFPEAPEFLWQTSFGAMGDTVANPAITQVNVDWMGETQMRAVAILPGGEGMASTDTCTGGYSLDKGVTRAQFPENNTRNVRCWRQRGRSLYVVDVATGRLIQEFGPEHFPSPLTGSVVVDGLGTARSSASYFFDDDGVLWRLSMLNTDPSKWRAQPIYDMFADPFDTTGTVDPRPSWKAGRAPTYAPTLTYDRLGNLVVLAGTGNLDSPLDTAYQRVVSLTEYRDAGLSDEEIAGTMVLNWKLDLRSNEAVSGPLTVLDNVVYFASFRSTADENDLCGLGVSRIYAAHAFERNPASGDPKDWPAEPKPELIKTGSLPTDARVLYEEYDDGDSNQLIGLTIRRQPICLAGGLSQTNPVLGLPMDKTAPTGGGYEIVGMLSGKSAGGTPELGSELAQTSRTKLPDQRRQTISTWATYAE